jgi:hypothetical protein
MVTPTHETEPDVFFLSEPWRRSDGSFDTRLTPGNRTFFGGEREILEEGDDAKGPLERPVHWSIERRGEKVIYCSTFGSTAEELHRLAPGFLNADRARAGQATVRIETDVTEQWQKNERSTRRGHA